MLSTFQLHTPESQWFDSVRSVSVKYYLARHSSSSRISLFSIYLKVCPIIIKTYSRTSLVSQWIIHLPRQGTWVWSLVQEDPTSWAATKPEHFNYWAHTLEPMLSPWRRSRCSEKPQHCNSRVAHLHLRRPVYSNEESAQPKRKLIIHLTNLKKCCYLIIKRKKNYLGPSQFILSSFQSSSLFHSAAAASPFTCIPHMHIHTNTRVHTSMHTLIPIHNTPFPTSLYSMHILQVQKSSSSLSSIMPDHDYLSFWTYQGLTDT